MKKSSLVALAALAAAGAFSTAPTGSSARAQTAEAPSAKAQTQALADRATSDSKATRQLDRYVRRLLRAPRGKRYSASVRQHQRHAAKARRRTAERSRSR